jgi:CheY-like chemotaxis protein
MSDKLTILLVEDDKFAANITTKMLANDYNVQHVLNGAAALESISKALPDLVLLDVDMPGMSGYEVCETLRNDSTVGELPIIFLSGKVSDEERLAGYEAGGDDYLTKPVSTVDLLAKIRLGLANYAERRRLKADFSNAFTTAMTAMSSSAEIGAVLQFMRKSFSCHDYVSLGKEVLNTFTTLGFEASVKIHGQQGAIYYSPSGPCSQLEVSVLTNMSQQGRLFEFGSRTSCSYEHITIIIKSDARSDPDRHGRMKDNLAWLAEGADARVVALDGLAAMVKHDSLIEMHQTISKALEGIDQRHRAQGVKSGQIFEDLQRSFDRTMLSIGITQSQEDELAQLLLDAASRARGLYEEGLEISTHMEGLLKQLGAASNSQE